MLNFHVLVSKKVLMLEIFQITHDNVLNILDGNMWFFWNEFKIDKIFKKIIKHYNYYF
jgi:hypothetical protein